MTRAIVHFPSLPSFNHLLFLLLEEVPVFFPLSVRMLLYLSDSLWKFFLSSFLFKKTSIRSGVNHETKSRSVLQPQHTKYIQTVDGKLYNNKTKFENIFFFLPRENDVEIPLLLLLLFPIGTPTWSLDGSYRNSAENRVLPLSIGLSFLFVDSTKSNLFVFWL